MQTDLLTEPALAQLRAYWEALRRNGQPPDRAAVDPRGLSGVLGHAFLAEVTAPGMARFRVAGTAICALLGQEPRGQPLSTLLQPGDQAALAEAVAQVFEAPAVVDLWMQAPCGTGRAPLMARMLMMPLRDRAGSRPVMLGGLVTSAAMGRAPRAFALQRRLVARLVIPQTPPEPGLAESARPFTPAEVPPRAGPGRSHLRLVRSD